MNTCNFDYLNIGSGKLCHIVHLLSLTSSTTNTQTD